MTYVDALVRAKSEPKSKRALSDRLIVYFICIGELAYGLSVYIDPFRFAPYLVPPAAVFFWLTLGKGVMHLNNFRVVVGLSFVGVSILMSMSVARGIDLSILLYLISPFLLCVCISKISEGQFFQVFGSTLLAAIIHASGNAKGQELSINIIYSTSFAESQFTFPLAALFITLIATGQKKPAFFTFLIILAMFKRIAFVGIIAALLYLCVSHLFLRQREIGKRAQAVVATAISLCCLVALNLNEVAYQVYYLLRDYFDTVERLMLGRYTFASYLTSFMQNNTTGVEYLLGFGPGADRLLIGETYFPGQTFVVLNDYLLTRFNYGIVGLFAFFGLYLIALGISRVGLALCAMQAVLFMTDNTLIYSFHSMILIVCSIYGVNFLNQRSDEGRTPLGRHIKSLSN